MPTDPQATPTQRSRGRTERERESKHAGLWTAAGVGFGWILVMAVWQQGFTGYLLAFLLMYGVVALVGVQALVRHVLQRHTALIVACGLLLAWWGIGGTYSWPRDAALGSLAFLAVLVALPSSRLWLRRLPVRLQALWRLWRLRRRHAASAAGRAEREENARRLGEALQSGLGSLNARLREASRTDQAPPARAAPPIPPKPVRPALRSRTLALASLAVWLTLGSTDQLFESQPLPRAGSVQHPPAMAAAHAPLRIGLAMSGGGYRAALVHAGVVDALGSLGIPVTHISAVSGGAIIGSYLAVGGSPRAFLDAMIEGRFRMTRDLLAAPNLLRLPSPTVVPQLDVDLWPFFGNFLGWTCRPTWWIECCWLACPRTPGSGRALWWA